jgi:hypothetical protein
MTLLMGALRYAVGIALALAAIAKVRDFGAFRRGLAAYGLHGWAGLAGATAVCAAEAVTALLCFAPVGAATAGVPVAALGLAFTAAQTYLLGTGTRAPCLCFGATGAAPVSIRSWTLAALVLCGGLVLVFASAGAG